MSPTRRAGERGASTVLLLATLLGLAGCVSLPVTGTVQPGPTAEQAEQNNAPDYSPAGPERGDTPVEVVAGFLRAMQANPVTTFVARKFLSSEGSNGWVPERRTVVFGSSTISARESSVTVMLQDTVSLDARGQWLGNTSQGRTVQYPLKLVREKGQWRISNPPDALVVPQAHFESRFQQYFLYFFDKSGQVLVPEPVYLPRGQQAPTMLIRGLLMGPDQELLGATRTYFPARTELDLSVPVSRDGIAEVPLSDEVLDLGDEALQKAMAQLSWTLRQVPGVERIRVTIDGSPMNVPAAGTEQDVQSWLEFDPSVSWASEELFGIRDGLVVTLLGGQERPISGLFGTRSHGLQSIAVDLPGELVAGVTEDRTTVLRAPRGRESGGVADDATADVVFSGGTDLLRPAWDIYGQLWVLDRRREGATLSVVRSDTAVEVDAPGITGESVKAFLMSRDGTRLVAVIDGEGADRLVVARVMRSDDGRVRRVAAATPLPIGAFQVKEVRDVAWSTPGSVAVLTGPAPGDARVVITRIDGSSSLGDVASTVEAFRDEAVRIVTSPAPGAPLYIGTTDGRLFELAANGRWTGTSVQGGLVSPTFVG